jgi:hypothetical protein
MLLLLLLACGRVGAGRTVALFFLDESDIVAGVVLDCGQGERTVSCVDRRGVRGASRVGGSGAGATCPQAWMRGR